MKLKIALIGNMNNNFFSLKRYLEDYGHTCHLFLFNTEHNIFHPENDTWEYSEQSKTIFYLSYGKTYFDFLKKFQKYNRQFDAYDLKIGCGFSPYYFEKINSKLDFFVPFGSDLCQYPFKWQFNFDLKHLIYKFIHDLFIYKKQAKGIKNCSNIFAKELSNSYKRSCSVLNISLNKITVPIIYIENKSNKIALDSDLLKKIENIKKFEFKIMSHSRQLWTKPEPGIDLTDLKRNDLLILGFSEFLKKTNSNSCLILFEYGSDIVNSKNLIENLKIKKNVIWLPKTKKKYIYELIKKYIDVGADQFGGANFGATSQEYMAFGKPVLNRLNINLKQYKKITNIDKLPPIINTKDESEICDELTKLYLNKNYRKNIGIKSKQWFDDYLGLTPASNFNEFIIDYCQKRFLNQ